MLEPETEDTSCKGEELTQNGRLRWVMLTHLHELCVIATSYDILLKEKTRWSVRCSVFALVYELG